MGRRLLLIGREQQMVRLARALVGSLPADRGGHDSGGLGLGDRARRVLFPSAMRQHEQRAARRRFEPIIRGVE